MTEDTSAPTIDIVTAQAYAAALGSDFVFNHEPDDGHGSLSCVDHLDDAMIFSLSATPEGEMKMFILSDSEGIEIPMSTPPDKIVAFWSAVKAVKAATIPRRNPEAAESFRKTMSGLGLDLRHYGNLVWEGPRYGLVFAHV